MASEADKRGHWSGQFGFILACTGSAIGLGNIWKFPYITHHNGGGAFVLIYLICILLVGLPIMLAEIFMGKSTSRSSVSAFRRLRQNSKLWPWIGAVAVLASFSVLSYYSVVAGWVLHYILQSTQGTLNGMSQQEVADYFQSFASNDGLQLFYHLTTMLMVTGIVLGGIKGGIERANKILMPLLFIILGSLMVYAMWNYSGKEAAIFLFDPSNFSHMRAGGILEALGHSFFTLSLAMGVMITYGSYMDRDEHVMSAGFWIVIADTVIALMACFLIYSILFSFDQEVGAGPGLLFVTLPILIEQMTGGGLAAALFFCLVFFAALTSAISLLEVVVAYWVDEWNLRRKSATLLSASLIFLAGIPSALSLGALRGISIGGRNIFDFVDYLASNWMLPVGGLLTAVFVAYFVSEKRLREEVAERWPLLYPGWMFVLRYITPFLVVLVIGKTTGVWDWLFA
ncbi:MAG: sodium-dependent transporter [Chlamydiia bacterium]|nr:sodium-dependent transporter [Chlamydiia bacterium]